MSIKDHPRYSEAAQMLSKDNSTRFVCKTLGLSRVDVSAIKRNVVMAGNEKALGNRGRQTEPARGQGI